MLLLAWLVIGERLTAERLAGILLIVPAPFPGHCKPQPKDQT